MLRFYNPQETRRVVAAPFSIVDSLTIYTLGLTESQQHNVPYEIYPYG